jgi:hypothetical protein
MERFWENFPLAIEHDSCYDIRMENDLEGGYYYAQMRMRTGVCIRFVHAGIPADNTIPNMLGMDSGEMKEQILAFNKTSNVDIELREV